MVSTNENNTTEAIVVVPENATTVTTNEDDFEKAQKTYQLGKKNLLLNKYDDAVNNIADACKIYSTKYGEFAPECAEIYFYYGKALLELARVENTVLGNALDGVPQNDTEPINDSRYGNPDEVATEEKEDIADKVIDAMCESEKPEDAVVVGESEKTVDPVEEGVKEEIKATNEEEKQVENGEKIETENGETKETENGEKTENGTEEPEGEDGEGEEEEGEEEEGEEDLCKNDEAEAEDVSNLQMAWEFFELAKLVYTKNFENDLPFKNKRIAECLIKLGEISIEQELYEQALTDIKESIRIQEERPTSEREERMLAESYYQLGLAYQFSEQYPLAGDAFQKSINILQLKIDKLKALVEQSTEECEKNTYNDEIVELEALLPEIVSKLEESKEQGEQSDNLIKEAKACFLNNNEAEKTPATATTEVKDITNLIKSKRKVDEVNNDDDDASTKKTKVDDNNDAIETDAQ